MTGRIIVGILSLVCVSIFGLLSAITGLQIVEHVNNKLPPGSHFGELGWHWLKTQRLHREYGRLYPGGQLLRKVRILWGLGIMSLVISAWGFGIFLT